MEHIYFDINNPNTQQTIHCKQHDVGRTFRAKVTDGDAQWNAPNGAIFTVWYNGTSGEGNYTKIGEKNAVSYQDGILTVELIEQMLSNKGGGNLCITVNDASGNQIGFWNIAYLVQGIPGADSEAASEHFTAFSELAASAAEAANAAANCIDAVASYEKTVNRMYSAGTGEEFTLTNVDNAKAPRRNGWFGYNTSTKNMPSEFTYGVIEVSARDTKCVFQTLRDTAGHVVRRMYDKNTENFTEWEWENPPLQQGVVYRTTKRWKGCPVYAILINVGVYPNNSHKAFSGAVSGITNLVRSYITLYRDDMCFTNKETDVSITIGGGTVYFINNGVNTEGNSAYLYLEYIKEVV